MRTNDIKSKAMWSAGTTVVFSLAFMLVLSASPIANAGVAFATSDRMMSDNTMMMEQKPTILKGQVANVQLESGQPGWIQSGYWVLRINSQDSISFIAKINMVKPDGTALHMHKISELSVEDYSIENNVHSITGTVTITMSDDTVHNVPVTIKVVNDAVLAITIGPEGVNGHFGDGPIYGIAAPSRAAMMEGAMMEHKLTRTNVPVTIPLTMGFVNGHEVFYISTEASHKDLADHLTELTGFRVAFAPSLTKAPADSLANIYAFSNGIEGPGPLGFQPNVADSQPGDARYSPLWRVNVVEWQDGVTPRELRSEKEILDASSAGEVKITPTDMVVNCPFVQWEGGSLAVRENKNLADDTPYGGGQVLNIDTDKMQATFVAHRGFAPDGSTIYYIATDASVKEVADALGVVYVEKTGKALFTSASSDLWVFTNGIPGTGPMGFQASIAGSNVGDDAYSPLWRILATTWKDASQAKFLMTAQSISSAAGQGELATDIAGVVVNCPFVEV